MGAGETCMPVYRADIKTEAQANTTPDLPLLYVWNEIVDNGALKAYSFSVNGLIVGDILEKRLLRSHPDFVRLRDIIMDVIKESQNKVVMDTCIRTRQRPSVLYSHTVERRDQQTPEHREHINTGSGSINTGSVKSVNPIRI